MSERICMSVDMAMRCVGRESVRSEDASWSRWSAAKALQRASDWNGGNAAMA
jgi:hypothetical protein